MKSKDLVLPCTVTDLARPFCHTLCLWCVLGKRRPSS